MRLLRATDTSEMGRLALLQTGINTERKQSLVTNGVTATE
jgi:hypothetical protein